MIGFQEREYGLRKKKHPLRFKEDSGKVYRKSYFFYGYCMELPSERLSVVYLHQRKPI